MSSLSPVSGSAEEILALLRDWDAADDPVLLVIETSGSTGHPKRVQLSRDAMRASALATQDRLGGPGQWLLNLPPTYVAGVQVLYRSVVAGTEPVFLREHEPLEDARQRMTHERRYVSLVPTQLFRILERGEDLGFTTVLIGGGPLDREVRAQAESRGIAVVQTYGMSETCGGCVYDGIPLAGVEVRIDPDGEVLLRGPMVFDGYEGDSERTSAAFRDGWLVTNDVGHWADDRLRIDGRADDMIISGGVKVPARAVATQLTGSLAVRAVEVIGVPDAEWGERVVAVVETSHPLSLDEVRAAVEPREWAPRSLALVERLPELANGKPDRLAIQKLALDA